MAHVDRYPDVPPSWKARGGWSLIWEWNRWGKSLLISIPGAVGSFLRRHFYRFAACGRDNLIMEHIWVEYPDRLRIGDHCNINRDCFIQAAGGVTIGDWVLIAPYVAIISQNHLFDGIDVPIAMAPEPHSAVVIEDDVWIGTRAVVLPGAHLGRGCVVAAGAVVRGEVEPFSMVAGIPAKHIRYRDEAREREERGAS